MPRWIFGHPPVLTLLPANVNHFSKEEKEWIVKTTTLAVLRYLKSLAYC